MNRLPNNDAVASMQRVYFLQQVSDLFGFVDVASAFYSAMRIVSEHFGRTFPKLALEYKARNAFLIKEVMDVANTFKQQYTSMIGQEPDYATNAQLQERITKGAAYFLKKLKEVEGLVSAASDRSLRHSLRRSYTSLFTMSSAVSCAAGVVIDVRVMVVEPEAPEAARRPLPSFTRSASSMAASALARR